jgi:hypothetical protein
MMAPRVFEGAERRNVLVAPRTAWSAAPGRERPTEFLMRRPKHSERSAHLRSYETSDRRIASTGHSLFALITRTCDPSDRLMRA